MTIGFPDVVRETTTATGTSDFTFTGGANVTDRCQAMDDGLVDGQEYYYWADNETDREIGRGTWTSGTSTLSRDEVKLSTNGGAKCNFGSAPEVAIVVAGEWFEDVASVPSGDTLPSSPAPKQGDQFLHTPTGRKFLMQYDGSAWIPIYAFGSSTLYVDGGSGGTSQNLGHGTGADAWSTIQQALDELPPLFSGDVTINIAAGTYTENVVIDGKAPTGDFSLTLTASLNQLDSLTASSGVTGSGSTRATAVRNSGTWTTNQRANKLCRFTSGNNSGVTRLIDTNTSTTLTLCGTWDGSISNGDTFVVEEIQVTIDGSTGGNAVDVRAGMKNVYIENIKLTSTGTHNNDNAAFLTKALYVELQRCWIEQTATNPGLGEVQYWHCYFSDKSSGTTIGCFTNGGGKTRTARSKLADLSHSSYACLRSDGSLLQCGYGTVIDGGSNSSVNGIQAGLNARVQCFSADANGHSVVRNCNIGLNAQTNTTLAYYSDIALSGNTTNASPAVGANTENPLVNSTG